MPNIATEAAHVLVPIGQEDDSQSAGSSKRLLATQSPR